jgi:hypothetical protein
MVLDSDEALEAFTIVVWLVVLKLLLVEWRFRAHSLNVLYGNEPPVVIKVLPASWDWYLYHI